MSPRSLNSCSLVLAALLLASGCQTEDEAPTAAIDLYETDHDQRAIGGPLLEEGGEARVIEVVIIQQHDPKGTARVANFRIDGREGTLGQLPAGAGYQIFVRGFAGTDPSDVTPVFYGASRPFDVEPGEEPPGVSVQIGKSDCVGSNRGSPSNAQAEGAVDLISQRVGYTMTPLPDGRVLVAGGAIVDASGQITQILDTIEIYDPNRGQFVEAPEPLRLSVPSAFHTATVLGNGRSDDPNRGNILIVGGLSDVGGVKQTLRLATIIDVKTDPSLPRIVPLGAPAFPDGEGRYLHQATLLPQDGSVLITGGRRLNGSPLSTTWRYMPSNTNDPSLGSFRQQGPLCRPRYHHTASAIRRGDVPVVVAGGLGLADDEETEQVLEAIEVFTVNPEQQGCCGDATPQQLNGCFLLPRGKRMSEPRWGHRAVPVNGGEQVLFVGGFSTVDGSAGASGLEMLDSDLTLRGPDMVGQLAGTGHRGRGGMSAVALPDDSVVLIGGCPEGAAAQAATPGENVAPLSGCPGGNPTAQVTRLRPSRVGATISGFAESPVEEFCGLSEARFGQEAALMSNGTVLVAGGITGTPAMLIGSRRAEIYFPVAVDLQRYYP